MDTRILNFRHLLSDTYYLYVRSLRYFLRTPIFMFFTLVQPLIWLLLFSQLFKNLVLLPGFPTKSYLEFFAPGVMVMTVLFGSAWSGSGMVRDIDLGFLEKIMVTPVRRPAIVLGRVLAHITTLVAQAIIIILVAELMGLRIATGFPGFLLAVILVTLMGVGFASFANGLAIIFKREEPLVALATFLTMPLMFTSTAMMPASLMPHWLQVAARFNPVNYTIQGVRSLFMTGYDAAILIPSFLLITAFAILTLYFATNTIRRGL